MTLQYLTSLVRHTPDTYLSELWQLLEVEWGVSVHESPSRDYCFVQDIL